MNKIDWAKIANAVEVVDMIEDCIDNAPTADVQEVKHGHWIEQAKIKKDGEVRLVHWQCSLCGCFLGTNTATIVQLVAQRWIWEDE